MPHTQIIYVSLFCLNLLQQVVGNQLQVLQFCCTLQGVHLDGRSGAGTIAQSVDLNDYFSIAESSFVHKLFQNKGEFACLLVIRTRVFIIASSSVMNGIRNKQISVWRMNCYFLL